MPQTHMRFKSIFHTMRSMWLELGTLGNEDGYVKEEDKEQ